jgi:uncharacterized peroxidase-related enzyme
VRAHADDLRAEVAGREDAADLVRAIAGDHHDAHITGAERAMLDYVVKLTRNPEAMAEADVRRLREQGWDDAGIHQIAQITGLFAYYNRLADGLGIDPEPEWKDRS